jgi:hypothetical protein
MQGKDLSEATSNRVAIDRIKNLYLQRKISRDVAEALAEPVIKRINKKQQEIAKKYGKRSYPKTTFIGLFR